MERLTGFEPASGRWRRPILPLDDSLVGLGGRVRTCVILLPRQAASHWPTPRGIWCEWRDSNPHLHGPQPWAYAPSATLAWASFLGARDLVCDDPSCGAPGLGGSAGNSTRSSCVQGRHATRQHFGPLNGGTYGIRTRDVCRDSAPRTARLLQRSENPAEGIGRGLTSRRRSSGAGDASRSAWNVDLPGEKASACPLFPPLAASSNATKVQLSSI